MTFSDYQIKTSTTAVYPEMVLGVRTVRFIYPALGLAGESGEVVEKVKKLIRDRAGSVTDESRNQIKKELGDVLWYMSQLCNELMIDFNDVAESNIKKLESRKSRGKLQGNGDER